MELTKRPRRLRGTDTIRRLCRETRISPDSLIYPLFVDETLSGRRPIPSLPGQYHYGLDTLPHSPGPFLMFSVLGLNHKNSYRHVFACSVCIPVLVVVVATAICVFAGI